MVDNISVTPEKIRGYGNIVIPHKDYLFYHSFLTQTIGTINDIDTPVNTLKHESFGSEFFTTLKNQLNNVEYLYTSISDINGELIAEPLSTSNINTVSDLTGVIYDLTVDENDNWKYKEFTPSNSDLSDRELLNLQKLLVDFTEDDGILYITTLEEVE